MVEVGFPVLFGVKISDQRRVRVVVPEAKIATEFKAFDDVDLTRQAGKTVKEGLLLLVGGFFGESQHESVSECHIAE